MARTDAYPRKKKARADGPGSIERLTPVTRFSNSHVAQPLRVATPAWMEKSPACNHDKLSKAEPQGQGQDLTLCVTGSTID